MRPWDVWSKNTKFIEFGIRDGIVGASLLEAGLKRFLGVVTREQLRASLSATQSNLAENLVCSSDKKAIRRNNADVLILSGGALFSLWRFKNFRHVQHIAYYLRPELLTPLAMLLCLIHMLLGRISRPKVVRCVASPQRSRLLITFKVRRQQHSKSARRYIPHSIGVSGLLTRLNEQQHRYVVLRWFESLPQLPEGEDLDLLIDDDCLNPIEDILDEGPGLQPCDVYTVTGLPGTSYRKMPYFPPLAAEALLNDAIISPAGYRVPLPMQHFMSLSYHALYHKGSSSGLPSRGDHNHTTVHAEHDYTSILENLARSVPAKTAITFEDLDQYLDTQGWRPPHDMLIRLARYNRRIRALLGSSDERAEDPGLAVFILRQKAMDRGGLDRLVPLLEEAGFQIVRTKELAPQQQKIVAGSIRGGNWGRGPWGTSGGLPAAAIVAYDPEPLSLNKSQKKKFPHCVNARLLKKKMIREAFNEGYSHEQSCNVLHSSDNSREALDYMRIIIPEDIERIRMQIGQVNQQRNTEEPVLGTLTKRGRRRSKLEVVSFDNQLAVKKTFKPQYQQHLLREVEAMRELSLSVSEIPPLLDETNNAVIYPYYHDVLQYRRSSGKMLPLPIAKQAIRALEQVYEAGYALIDAHTENLLLDREHGLKMIDFEFLHRYENKPASFELSYDIAGCPDNFQGDLPHGGSCSYARSWHPYVGLSLKSLLNDPLWIQHLKRTVYYLVHWPRYLPRRIRHLYRTVKQSHQQNVEVPNSVHESEPSGVDGLSRAA